MSDRRGIRISLAYRSWQLICEVLVYLLQKPHLEDLEKRREEIGNVLGYIQRKLEER